MKADTPTCHCTWNADLRSLQLSIEHRHWLTGMASIYFVSHLLVSYHYSYKPDLRLSRNILVSFGSKHGPDLSTFTGRGALTDIEKIQRQTFQQIRPHQASNSLITFEDRMLWTLSFNPVTTSCLEKAQCVICFLITYSTRRANPIVASDSSSANGILKIYTWALASVDNITWI